MLIVPVLLPLRGTWKMYWAASVGCGEKRLQSDAIFLPVKRIGMPCDCPTAFH